MRRPPGDEARRFEGLVVRESRAGEQTGDEHTHRRCSLTASVDVASDQTSRDWARDLLKLQYGQHAAKADVLARKHHEFQYFSL